MMKKMKTMFLGCPDHGREERRMDRLQAEFHLETQELRVHVRCERNHGLDAAQFKENPSFLFFSSSLARLGDLGYSLLHWVTSGLLGLPWVTEVTYGETLSIGPNISEATPLSEIGVFLFAF